MSQKVKIGLDYKGDNLYKIRLRKKSNISSMIIYRKGEDRWTVARKTAKEFPKYYITELQLLNLKQVIKLAFKFLPKQ